MPGSWRAIAAVAVATATAAVGCGPATAPRLAPPAGMAPGHGQGAPASAWPGAIHDSRHSSAVAAGVVGPQTGMVRWERDLGANVTPGPALAADGTVYVATNAGTLYGLDPSTGADRWTFDGGSRYGSDLSTTPAVLDDGTVLWPGPANTLFALDPAGHLLWRQTFAGFALSPAARGDGRVYVMDMAGTLTALDVSASRHDTAWTVHLGATSYGSPAIAPDGSVVTTVDDQVIAVTDTGSTGVVRWRWRAPATIEVSPAVAPDGTVVVGPTGGGCSTWTRDPPSTAIQRSAQTGPCSWARRTATSTLSRRPAVGALQLGPPGRGPSPPLDEGTACDHVGPA